MYYFNTIRNVSILLEFAQHLRVKYPNQCLICVNTWTKQVCVLYDGSFDICISKRYRNYRVDLDLENIQLFKLPFGIVLEIFRLHIVDSLLNLKNVFLMFIRKSKRLVINSSLPEWKNLFSLNIFSHSYKELEDKIEISYILEYRLAFPLEFCYSPSTIYTIPFQQTCQLISENEEFEPCNQYKSFEDFKSVWYLRHRVDKSYIKTDAVDKILINNHEAIMPAKLYTKYPLTEVEIIDEAEFVIRSAVQNEIYKPLEDAFANLVLVPSIKMNLTNYVDSTIIDELLLSQASDLGIFDEKFCADVESFIERVDKEISEQADKKLNKNQNNEYPSRIKKIQKKKLQKKSRYSTETNASETETLV